MSNIFNRKWQLIRKSGRTHDTTRNQHSGYDFVFNFPTPKNNIYEQHNNLHPMIYEQWNSLIGAKLKPNTHFRFLKCASFWPNVLALRWWTCLNFSNRLTAVVNSYRLKTMSELNARERTAAENRTHSHANEMKEEKLFLSRVNQTKKSSPNICL